jgi:pSer/pThr/pTyr-binding forkhead associated (FHA) protein
VATNFVLKAAASAKRIEINGTLTAGRNPDCDLVLSQGHPSRRHAEVSLEEGRVWVKDLGSANGTFVNDRQITDRTALNAGDRVRFDAEEFIFESSAPPAADNATVVRAPDAAAPAHQTVIAQNRPRTPGSWADPDARGGGQGTRLFDPAELEKIRAGGPAVTPTEPVDAPYLVVQSGRHAGERLKLKPGRETNVWEIGSEQERDILIDDAGVSAFHAKVVNEGNRWKVIDQMSANGTYVNGQKSNISYLKHGDRVRLGPVECLFQLPAQGGRATRSGTGGGRPTWLIATVAFVVTAAVIGAALYFLR